ncbi:MAG: acyl-CoA dehydrogenase family protein [Nocardioides sp.]
MRFELSEDQRDFRAALDDLLSSADTVAAARAWGEGEHSPGLGIWKRLADLGVNGLLVDGGTHVDLAVAHEALGYHLAVGPWIEAAALSSSRGGRVAAGELLTVAAPGVSYALDADVADLVGGTVGERLESVDATRRLFRVEGGPVGDADIAALACAAQLLGAGERVLADTVTYVQQRRQFGRAIGSFQAVKHQLADVRIALDFARPLVFGAALSGEPRDVSAAKAYASDAAWKAARTALQLHGAVGYTRELDLGLWILRIRALCSAWGTPTFHRGRVLESLVQR